MKSAILLCWLALLGGRVLAQGAALEEIRADCARGDFRAGLQKTDKILSSSLAKPADSEKYEIFMLRGECQLQLKDRIGAVASFKSAAKHAGELKELAAAKANALIVDRSSMGSYRPNYGAGREPIDILAPEPRKRAMLALEAELWSRNKTQIAAALKATTLPPIEKVFAPLSDMLCLELAATGETADTGKVMRELGQQTYRLMQAEATTYARQIEQLSLAANSSSNWDGNWGGGRRGLFSTERNELKVKTVYLAKLRDRAAEYRGVANKLGGNEQRWDGLVVDITDTLAVADALLNDQ